MRVFMRRMDTSYIYVIGCFEDMDKVKIGLSCNPINRLAQLQISSPNLLHIWGTFPLPSMVVADAEKLIHKELGDYRLRGEWFKCSPKKALSLCEKTINFNFCQKVKSKGGYPKWCFEDSLKSLRPDISKRVMGKLA